MADTDAARHYEQLMRLVRVARGLDAGGYYNAAKLFWALVFSQDLRASNERGIPIAADELDRELQAAISAVAAEGTKPELVAALQHGREGVRNDRTFSLSEIPRVFVCRTCGEIALNEAPRRCPTCGARLLTFREFPPVYFLEPLELQQALTALVSAPAEVQEAVEGLSAAQMAQAPTPGEWAIRDVFSHLLVAQGLLAGRVDKMLAEENPSLAGVAAWAIDGDKDRSAFEILEQYRASRAETVAKLKSISFQDWWRTAQHEEFGEVTILHQASYFAKHERSHLPQIDAISTLISRG